MTPEEMARLHGAAFERGWSADEIVELCAAKATVLEKAPQGFAMARILADEAEILTIVVDADARQSGQGAALMRALLARLQARGARQVFLEVATDNAAARALYDRLGFAEVGRRRGYYARKTGAPVDALVLSAELSA